MEQLNNHITSKNCVNTKDDYHSLLKYFESSENNIKSFDNIKVLFVLNNISNYPINPINDSSPWYRVKIFNNQRCQVTKDIQPIFSSKLTDDNVTFVNIYDGKGGLCDGLHLVKNGSDKHSLLLESYCSSLDQKTGENPITVDDINSLTPRRSHQSTLDTLNQHDSMVNTYVSKVAISDTFPTIGNWSNYEAID